LDGFGSPKPSQNEDRDAPKYPQGTHGTPPAHPRGQQGFPNSIFDGSSSIWDRFWKALGIKISPKCFQNIQNLFLAFSYLLLQDTSKKLSRQKQKYFEKVGNSKFDRM